MIAVGSVTNGSHLFLQDLLPHRVHAKPWSICVLITHSVNFVSRHAFAFGVLHPLFRIYRLSLSFSDMGLKTQKLATSLDSFPLANRLLQTLLLKVTHYGMTPTTMVLNQLLRPYGKELFLGMLVLKRFSGLKDTWTFIYPSTTQP